MANLEETKITRRSALRLSASMTVLAAAGTLGIYGCSDGSGNGSDTQASGSDALEAIKAAVGPTLTGDIAAMALRNPSENLGQLAFNNASGEAIFMADTGSKIRLVNLWATWCAPCREEMPWLDELQAQRGGDNFEVIAISVDGGSAEKPTAFFNEIGLQNLAFYHDPTIGVFNELKRQGLAFGLPVTILMDRENNVIANMNGPAHWSSPDAFAMVDAAIAASG